MLWNCDRSQTVWNDNNEYKHKIQEEIQRTINIRQACHHSFQNIISSYLYPKIIRNESHKIMNAYLSVWQRWQEEEMEDITYKRTPKTYCTAIYILFLLARYSDYDSKWYFTLSTGVY